VPSWIEQWLLNTSLICFFAPFGHMILTRYRGVVESGQVDLEKEITMPKPQQSFTAEFKHEAVQLTKTSDKPKAQIARELGISDSALYAWCRAAEAHGEEAFPGKGHQLPLEEEIHRLKRELERAQQERDILKKAISIFSRNQL
jgi:transposase